jgi:hypothetical protein
MQKIFIYLILYLLCIANSFANTQHNISIDFNISSDVILNKYFKLSIAKDNKTVILFDKIKLNNFPKFNAKYSFDNDSVDFIFEYSEDKETWKEIHFPVKIDTNRLKRVEVQLSFGINDSYKEFLEELEINPVYYTNSVKVVPNEFDFVKRPYFYLINQSDTLFYGNNMIQHFFGNLNYKTKYGWYMMDSTLEFFDYIHKPLAKYDTAISYVPSTFAWRNYKINRFGLYKYFIKLSTVPYNSNGYSLEMYEQCITNKKIVKLYEVEYFFWVEEGGLINACQRKY